MIGSEESGHITVSRCTMSFNILPPEMLILIADQLETNNLFNLLRANRMLYSLLIESLYKANVRSDGGSAIVWYSCRGNEAGVRRMVAAGADVNHRPLSQDQSTALLEAVQHNHTNVVQTLLKRGAWPDAANLRCMRPLTVAANRHGDIAIVQLLLDHGAKADIIASDKRAPLLEAIVARQFAKSMLLLKHGADPHVSSRLGMNLLHVVAQKNAPSETIASLIKAGLPIESFDQYGRTPLQVAVESSSARAVSAFLQLGANPNAKCERGTNSGLPTLFLAIPPKSGMRRSKKILQTLLTHGVSIDSKGPKNQTPLFYAISRGALEHARLLLQAGANIRARNSEQESLLHAAFSISNPSTDLITWLVQNGADVNWVGGKRQETPLFYAISRSSNGLNSYGLKPENANVVESLLSYGANANFRNLNGTTPLSIASRACSVALSRVLIQYGACIYSKDQFGRSHLHYVFDGPPSKQRAMIKFLIQQGADVNSRDYNGYTPLHKAVSQDWTWEVAEELFKVGADRCALSSDGKYPYDMIPDGPFAETQRLILRHYPV